MKLTVAQKFWLNELWKAYTFNPNKVLSVVYDRPPATVMKALERKGLCQNVMDTFWKITNEGRQQFNQMLKEE